MSGVERFVTTTDFLLPTHIDRVLISIEKQGKVMKDMFNNVSKEQTTLKSELTKVPPMKEQLERLADEVRAVIADNVNLRARNNVLEEQAVDVLRAQSVVLEKHTMLEELIFGLRQAKRALLDEEMDRLKRENKDLSDEAVVLRQETLTAVASATAERALLAQDRVSQLHHATVLDQVGLYHQDVVGILRSTYGSGPEFANPKIE